MSLPVGLDGEELAGIDGMAIEKDGAESAGALAVAAVAHRNDSFGAQSVAERYARIEFPCDALAVEPERGLHGIASDQGVGQQLGAAHPLEARAGPEVVDGLEKGSGRDLYRLARG